MNAHALREVDGSSDQCDTVSLYYAMSREPNDGVGCVPVARMRFHDVVSPRSLVRNGCPVVQCTLCTTQSHRRCRTSLCALISRPPCRRRVQAGSLQWMALAAARVALPRPPQELQHRPRRPSHAPPRRGLPGPRPHAMRIAASIERRSSSSGWRARRS